MRFLVCLFLLLSACAPATQINSVARTYVYDCKGGYQFPARVEGENLWLFLPTGTVQLSSQPSASGVKYLGDGIEFWSKGDEAQLTLEGQRQRVCTNDRSAAIWEDAKFRGVDFRAAGNEPGWFVEMDPDRIIYAGNYGRQLLTFPYAPPQIDDQLALSKFVAKDDQGHNLEIVLQAGYCYDSMSGEKFETRVTLNLDGKTHYGCGRALH